MIAKTFTILFAFIALVLLSGLTLGAEAKTQEQPTGTPVSGAEMKEMFTGGTILDAFHKTKGWRMTMVLLETGATMSIGVLPGGKRGWQDVGTWRIEDNALCVKWKKSRKGADVCYRHFKVGDNQFESWYAASIKYSMTYSLRK